MICKFHTCSVCQCDENEIPLPWKQDSENDNVDKKIDEKFYQWVEKYNYSSNQWLVESEIDSNYGIYVNLEKNPHMFTGYQGQHIWNAIYEENCFSNHLHKLCIEEKIFYKMISGLHSNINLHLSKNFLEVEKNSTNINNIENTQVNNTNYFNYAMLNERVLDFKDRVNNLFFLHTILVNTFYKAKANFEKYDIYTGNKTEDFKTQKALKELLVNKDIENFYRSSFYTSENLKKFLKSDKLDQIKMRFRNISSIIDCVSCQKCKLYGKLQIYGMATMLKILFSREENLKLKRNEFISFINLVGKVSGSIKYITEYIDMLKDDAVKFKEIYFFFIGLIFFIMIYLNYKYITNREKYDDKFRRKKIAEREFYSYIQKAPPEEIIKGANIVIENKKKR